MKNWFVILMLLLTSFMWGTSFIATEMVLQEASVLTTLVCRLGLASLVLLIVVLIKDRGMARITGKSLFYLVVLGLLSTSLYQLVQISANKLANASITALFTSLHPMVLAVFGWIFFKEKMGWFKVGGILLGLVGSLYIATKGTFTLNGNIHYSVALLLLLLNSFMWAAYSSLSKKLDQVFSSFDLIAYMTIIGFIAFLPLALILAHYQRIDLVQEMTRLSLRAVGALVYLSIFCTILAYMLWIYCLRRMDMGKAGYFIYLEPVFAMAVAPLFVGNQINHYVLVGALLIFLGLVFINMRKKANAV